jgi:hypothetical protein
MVGSSNTLALVAVLENFDVVVAGRGLTHEVPDAHGEACSISIPPSAHPTLIRPGQTVIIVVLDVRVCNVIVGTQCKSLRRPTLHIEMSQVDTCDETEGFARQSATFVIRHMTNQPWNVRGIANQGSATNELSQLIMAREFAQ